MTYLAIISAILSVCAIAYIIHDTIKLKRAIKAREQRDKAMRAYECRVIAEHERCEKEGHQ